MILECEKLLRNIKESDALSHDDSADFTIEDDVDSFLVDVVPNSEIIKQQSKTFLETDNIKMHTERELKFQI